MSIHTVLNYFEKVSYDEVNEASIHCVYYSTFMIHIKQKILQSSNELYKIESKIELPECMKQGSLKQVISMKHLNHVFEFFMPKHIQDIQYSIYTAKRTYC